MSSLPLGGLIAPGFIALAIAAGFLNFRIDSGGLDWLGLLFLALALRFAPDTRRLFDNAMRAVRGDSTDK
jgi:hypothetical protein